jgi:YidC/Oxa1 family membrane protein insertase
VKKDDQKNFLIFAVLAALILFGWPQITHWFFPQQQPAPVKYEGGKAKPVANPGADPAADSPKALRDRQIVLSESPRVAIETPKLRGSINLKGARIDDLVLVQYAETVAKNSPPIRLLSPGGAKGAYFAQFGWQGAGVQAPDPDTVWQASGTKLTPATPVTLSARSATGQVFRIELSVDANYMFTVRQTVANLGGAPVSVTPFALVSRADKSTDVDQWAAHVGPIAVSQGAANYVNYKDVDAGTQAFSTTGGWVGYTDHYWLTAVVPDQRVPVQLQQRQTPTKSYQADYQLAAPLSVAAS